MAAADLVGDLSAVLGETRTARGLPNGFYISEDVAAEERRKVFEGQWTAIGFGKDVPNAGDTYPVDFVGTPLVIVRDEDGAVRVFENVCRHRGMILVEEPKNVRRQIRCPYHSWCYDLKGKLRATPHVGGPGVNEHPDMDKALLGLIEIRSTVWRDVVFVNMSGTAPAFEVDAASLIERWAEFEKPVYHAGPDSSFELVVQSNWKLAVENFCESYHLPFVHPGLNSYSRLEDHYMIIENDEFSGQGTLVYNPMLDESGRQFPKFEGLSDKWDVAAEYVALYPNVLLGVHKDHAFAIILEPTGLSGTRERVAIYYAKEEATGPDYADMRQRNTALWKGVFLEDIGVCEGMQKGRSSQFDGGKFSPVMDTATHAFHAWVARAMTA